jgi:predicted ATPase/DNA-binding XRE family transcriptional regulator
MQEEISFGAWLRKQRRALDLTRQAFADQVGCAEVTVRRIEAGSLKPSKELAGIFLEKLGIPEPEHPQWISFARGLSGFPLLSSPSSNKPITNLPATLTTFIGREKEQLDLIKLITKYRLVTLSGPGGVGKTRLSFKIGEQVLEDYANGVRIVEFALILDPLLVPRTIAIAIGLHDEPKRPVIDMLSDYLRETEMLIIFDNCEHLLDACAQVADTLLKRCPRLKILATSREALDIRGEAVYPVPPLELPDMQQLLEKFREYESIRLFEDRAQLVRMDFSLTKENVPSVAEICSRLDGIPLAIELAAARVNMFSPEQIAASLQENFNLLTAGNRTALPRHQTIQATIDWSYDLLPIKERTLFQRLSVFVNGWTLEAAESICSDDYIKAGAILEMFTQLINKSLVIVAEIQRETRYHMLETIRQYANGKLVESGEKDNFRDRHLEYFLTLTETAAPHLIRSEQLEWLARLNADYENLRLALEWALSKKSAEPLLKLCINLWWFWKIRCYWLEGLTWIKRALAKPSRNESKNAKATRARALATQVDLEWQLGNFEQMLSPAQASLALASEVSDRKDIAIAKYYMGNTLRGLDNDQALSLMEQSFTEFQALNEPFWQALSFAHLGGLLAAQGKLKHRDKSEKSLELADKAGERLILADALSDYAIWLYKINILNEAVMRAEESNRLYEQIGFHSPNENSFVFARIAWIQGNTQEARSLHMEMLERYTLLGENVYRSVCITNLGLITMEAGDLDGAWAYLEEALVLSRQGGYKPFIAESLLQLGNLYYLQRNLKAFKQNMREGFSLKNYFTEAHKVFMLETTVGSLYYQKPESSVRLLGIIDHFEKEHDILLGPIAKRYLGPAKTHARKTLGDEVFKSIFAEGQKMSLDEALDLALNAIEEIE